MDFSIEQINKISVNQVDFMLTNNLNEKLYCNARLDEDQKLEELLVFNEKNCTYESIINLFSEPILCKIESASKIM